MQYLRLTLIDKVRNKDLEVTARLMLRRQRLSPCILLFHVADDGLSTIVYMDVLDTDKLLSAVAQTSKYLDLGGVSPHQASRRRPKRRNSLFRCEGDI